MAPNFRHIHQRIVAAVTHDRIDGKWDASEDPGASWRKDFELIFERVVAYSADYATPPPSRRTPFLTLARNFARHELSTT
jgi:hypothetical protein